MLQYSPCMKDGVCSKKFPKQYEPATRFDSAGYVHYKRPVSRYSFIKNDVPLDNGYVVPYNALLLRRFDAHITVEYCGWSMMIKYLFKYISKGADRIRFSLSCVKDTSNNDSQTECIIVDEINNFVDARFICPQEAAWRILTFPIHRRHPAVKILAVHLEGKQNLTFKQSVKLTEVANIPNVGKTTLTEWFVRNQNESSKKETSDAVGLDLRFIDYLSKFRWGSGAKKWMCRISKQTPSVGRLSYMHPICGELFYLRVLLTYQRGCCSYVNVRTIDGVVAPTFREACEKLGVTGNDKEWNTAISEAAEYGSARERRELFVYL